MQNRFFGAYLRILWEKSRAGSTPVSPIFKASFFKKTLYYGGMLEMPTTKASESVLEEIGQLIEDACQRGDNVSAIATRAGVDRATVSMLRNGTYRSSPTLDKIEMILSAIGRKISFQKA